MKVKGFEVKMLWEWYQEMLLMGVSSYLLSVIGADIEAGGMAPRCPKPKDMLVRSCTA